MIEKVVLNGEEHKLSPDYKDVRNKPSINGVELKEGDNKIEIIDINIDPDVDIVEEGETPSVTNIGTPKSPTLKFSLPKGEQGDKGKVYVPSVSDGELSWNLQDVTEQTPLPETANVRGPEGPKGDNAKNPFKGYYPDGTDKPTGEFNVGDYIYAPDSNDGSTTTIWSWDSTLNDNVGGWDDTSVVIDVGNLAEFANSTKKVSETNIVNDIDTGGEDDVLSAEAGKTLNETLYGERIITEIPLTLSSSSSPIIGSFANADSEAGAVWAPASDTGGIAGNYRRSRRVDVSGYTQLKITAGSSKAYVTFVKKALPELRNGDSGYTLEYLVTNDYINNTYTYNHVSDGISSNTTATLDIPEGTKYAYFVYHGKSSTSDWSPQSVIGISVSRTAGDIKNIQDTQESIQGTIDETTNTIDKMLLGTPVDVKDSLSEYGWFNMFPKQITIGSDYLDNNRYITYYIIPKDATCLKIEANESYNTYCLISNIASYPYGIYTSDDFKNNFAAECHSSYVDAIDTDMRIKIPAGTSKTIILSKDAKRITFLKQQGNDNIYTPAHVYVYIKEDTVTPVIDSITVGSPVSLKFGEYNSDGTYNPNSRKCVTTGLISLAYGYYLEVNSNYRLKRTSMFNDRGEMVTYNDAIFGSTSGTFWGLAASFPQYYIKATIIRRDNGDIDINDNIVKRFFNLNDKRISKETPQNIGIDYKLFQKKIAILTKPIWYAFNKIVVGASGNATSSYYFLKNTINRGTVYTQCDEHSGFVGQHISLRTYFTSLLNKRSVMYTEDVGVQRSKSSYNITHRCDNLLGGSYYGTVCSGLTSWLLNYLSIHTSFYSARGDRNENGLKSYFIGRNYDKDGNLLTDCYYAAKKDANNLLDFNSSYSSFDTIDNALDWIVNNIQVGDLLSKKGHVFIIGDIYLNEYGERELICVLEQVKPRERYIPYPIDMFKQRIRTTNSNRDTNDFTKISTPDISIARRTIDNNTKDVRTHIYDEDLGYIQNNFYDYNPKKYYIDPDICTFVGDYATFTTLPDTDTTNYTNKAILNIHRDSNNQNGAYTHLQIFNETTAVSNNTEPLAEYTLDDNNLWITESIKNQENQLIYEEDSSAKEDWIIFDLKNISTLLNAGKYKARVVRKIVDGNTTSITRTSGFTHWEMIGIDLSIVVDTTRQTIEAKYNTTGTPYMIRMESIAGSCANNGSRFKTLESAVFSDSDNLYHLNLDDWFRYYSTIDDDEKKGTGFIKIFIQGEYNDCVLRKVFNPNGTENPQDDGTETDGTAGENN